jgi:ZIP family zinc transporter
MLEAFFFGALSASSLLLGALLALRLKLSHRVIGLTMGFGAGALISAVSYELVEKANEVASRALVPAAGVAIGALTFFFGDLAIDRRGGARRKTIDPGVQDEDEDNNASAIVLGTILDGIPESIVVGGSIITGGTVSVAMVAAAFISNLPEALGSTAGLAKTTTEKRIMMMWVAIVAISGASAAFGYWLLEDASPDLGAFFQAFAAGAILTMLADSMMPEAFKEGGKLVGLATVFGFALALGISTLE